MLRGAQPITASLSPGHARGAHAGATARGTAAVQPTGPIANRGALLGSPPGPRRGDAARLAEEKGDSAEGGRPGVCSKGRGVWGEGRRGTEELGIEIPAGAERVGEEGGSVRVTPVQASE